MHECPAEIDGARVILASTIDDRHIATGNCRHLASGSALGEPYGGLAICQYPNDGGVYLFHCDTDWNVIADTWHASVPDAQSQAEFEFEGVSATWQSGLKGRRKERWHEKIARWDNIFDCLFLIFFAMLIVWFALTS